jgi:hypothetical protein
VLELVSALSTILLFPVPPVPRQETLIRLTVSPAAAPKPALRYALLPELAEMHSGNPIPGYLKCFLDQDFSTPMEVLGPSAMKQADRAARFDKPDWGILQKAKEDGIQLLLPDLQKVRALAQALQGRFREEITGQRFDDALVTAKTMFAMARHMEEHPTLIGGLVGIAVAQVAIQPLEEMLEQPGCPNLYWALTQLPHPLVSTRIGFQGERLLLAAELRDLDAVEPMTAAKIKKVIDHVEYIRRFEPDKIKDKTRAYVNKRAWDFKHVTAARKRLADAGIPDDRLATFPAEQIVLLDEKREYETRRDEVMKLMNLPTWDADRLASEVKEPTEPSLFSFLLPSNQRVRRAQGRLEQRIALLRHVEAIRMHAAANDGKLPAALADVTVPLPPDPFTGKPFKYEVTGSTAHLRGTPPKGEENNAPYNLHYEITIRK